MATPEPLAYSDVRNVNLEPLRQAVGKWGKLPGKIEGVSTTFSQTVSSPLERSGWYGETADAAFKKFRGIRHQMSEASGQAEKIGTVMADALRVFESAKKVLGEVETAVSTPPKDGDGKVYLKVNKKDGVVYLDPPAGVENTAGLTKAFHESIVYYNNKIREALQSAADADHDLKTALRIDPPGKGFNDDIAGRLKDVDAETKKDVDALMKLAGTEDFKKDPRLLSRFNGILAKNAQNADFAEQFANRKGAKWILDFWYKTARPDYEDGPLGEAKKRPAGVTKQLAALQDNMGRTLALASHSDSPGMTEWKKDVVKLGCQRMPGEQRTYFADPPYGFQVMSNLMRTGKWDRQFLDEYGDKLVETDKKPFDGPGGREEEQTHRKWLAHGQQPPDFLNFGKAYDQGEDPFTGYLEALGHNGDASTDFFKDDEHFDHLLRERKWLFDGEHHGEDPAKEVTGPRVALGHALASATTGHDWDDPPNISAEHTRDQADLMAKLVKTTGEVEEVDGKAHLKVPMAEGMHKSLGNAAAEYMPDFFRGIKDDDEVEGRLYPMKGEQADLNHRDVTRFLVQMGEDPDSKASVSAAQKLYTAQVLDHHLGGDVPAGKAYDTPENTVHEVLKTSGETAGTLAAGAQEAIIGPAVKEEQAYDDSTLSKRLWGNTAFGSVVTGLSVTKPLAEAHPVAAAVTAALVMGGEGAALSDQDAESWSLNKSAGASERAGAIYDEMAKRDVKQDRGILEAIAKEHNIKVGNSWPERFSDEGFSEGYSRVGSTARFLTSVDEVRKAAETN